MKKITLLILIFVLFEEQIFALDVYRSQISSVPDSSRFEIIQSELAAKITLKIDKYTGNIFQLVTSNKGLSWQLIPAEKHSKDTKKVNKANYQLFTSGLAIKMTYLLNINTGATWVLSEDNKIGVFWKAME